VRIRGFRQVGHNQDGVVAALSVERTSGVIPSVLSHK
jgi:hypothetical protein